MVTLASLPILARPETKPSRSMTHPLREPKNGKRRVKSGEPFDPAELSRRLEAHLEEQKRARAERHAAKAEAVAKAQKQDAYHHVPQVAASSFERTTTQDGVRKIHKLSEPVLRHHLETAALEDTVTGLPLIGLQRSQALDQALLKQEAVRSRNQFQWNRGMEEAAEADLERDVYRPPQRTFESDPHTTIGRKSARPLSTGDLLSEEDEESPPNTKKKIQPFHQTDWAQRDEYDGMDRRRTVKERMSPFLRKKESGWILGGKKEKLNIEKLGSSGVGQQDSQLEYEKASKGSFLARFKRHPS